MLYFLLWVVLFSLYLCAYSILFVYVTLLDWPSLEIIQCLVRFINLSLSVLSPYALCIVVPPHSILFLLVDLSAKDTVHAIFVFYLWLCSCLRWSFLIFFLIQWLLIAAAGDSYWSNYHRALVAFTLTVCIAFWPFHFCYHNTMGRWRALTENISNTIEIINSIHTNYLTLRHHCISKCGIRILWGLLCYCYYVFVWKILLGVLRQSYAFAYAGKQLYIR